MDKVTYSTDTRQQQFLVQHLSPATDAIPRDGIAATGNATHGYFGGGSPGARSNNG